MSDIAKEILDNVDISIEGIFRDGNKVFLLKRIYDSKNDYSETIFIKNYDYDKVEKIHNLFLDNEFGDEDIIQQKDVDDLFGITSSYFDIGCYVSQKESLKFLQNKYKDRNSEFIKISNVFNTNSIESKKNELETLKRQLSDYKTEKISEYKNCINELTDKLKDIQKLIENTSGMNSEYEPLFPSKHYDFDCKDIDTNIEYSTMINKIKNIELAIQKYPLYEIYCRNSVIDNIISTDKKIFKCLYYKKCIDEIKENKERIELLNKKKSIHDKIKHKKELSIEDFKSCGLDNKILSDIYELNNTIEQLKKQQDSQQESLTSIFQIRERFIGLFNENKENANWVKDICPLCGQQHEDLLNEIDKTTQKFKKIGDEISKTINDYNNKRDSLIENIDEKFVYELNESERLLNNFNKLKSLRNIKTSELEEKLREYNVVYHIYSNLEGDEDEFEAFMSDIVLQLDKMCDESQLDITDIEKDTIKIVLNEYYNEKKPKHTLEQIEKKYKYINSVYSLGWGKERFQLSEKIKQKEKIMKIFDEKISSRIDVITDFEKTLNKVSQDYQNNILEAIRLPVYVYSGRIIQNYPLGLGVIMKMVRNKLMFCPEKSEEDVYNVLSAGQLNGLVLSILLAVHKVFGKDKNLDMLLIDDPLQTIDDVSSISLTDLLVDLMTDGQIVLSTHEDSKIDLLNYKFVQAGYSVDVLDMQKEYLNN